MFGQEGAELFSHRDTLLGRVLFDCAVKRLMKVEGEAL